MRLANRFWPQLGGWLAPGWSNNSIQWKGRMMTLQPTRKPIRQISRQGLGYQPFFLEMIWGYQLDPTNHQDQIRIFLRFWTPPRGTIIGDVWRGPMCKRRFRRTGPCHFRCCLSPSPGPRHRGWVFAAWWSPFPCIERPRKNGSMLGGGSWGKLHPCFEW
jgi:hypothetical protein